MYGLNKTEVKILKSLNSPKKIQDFIENLKINFESHEETCMSPKMVLKTGKAHCVEGALLAATALRFQKQPPLIVDLTTNEKDYDHVLAVFKRNGKWGAITKTNHAVLRYRDPIYKTIRELVMSYFNEYFLDDGKKTLRSYTLPVNLSMFDGLNWISSDEEVWYIPDYLANTRHIPILTKSEILSLRKVDPIEVKAFELALWKRTGGKNGKLNKRKFRLKTKIKISV